MRDVPELRERDEWLRLARSHCHPSGLLERSADLAGPASMSDLPELPFEPWEPTKRTLHLWTQIVGKVRLASTAPQNHWWNATLYVDTRGLTTRRLRSPNGDFDVLFDFLGHKLVVHTSRGDIESFALEDGLSVAAFHDHLFASLRNLGIEVEIEAKALRSSR